MLTAMSADYIRTARAKGLKRHIIVVRHGFRNALVPSSPYRPCSWAPPVGCRADGTDLHDPRLRRLIVDSVYNRDYSVVSRRRKADDCDDLHASNLRRIWLGVVADPRVRR
jgi:peptide/nickel transport system permease protein